MSENTNYIISYYGDFERLKSGLKGVEAVNKAIAKQMGTEFANVTEIIKRQLDSIQTKDIKIGSGKEAKLIPGTLTQISTFAKTAQGDIVRLTETWRQLKGETKATLLPGMNISALNEPFDKLKGAVTTAIAPVARLSTEFNNVQQVNTKLAAQFGKSFGSIAEVVEKNTDRVRQAFVTIDGKKFAVPIQQLGAVVKKTDGTFAQLTKTITTLPDGTTKASYAMRTLAGDIKKTAGVIQQDLSGIDFTKNLEGVKAEGLKNATAQLGAGFKVLGQNVKGVNFKTFQEGAEKVSRPVITLATTVKDAQGKIGTFTQQMAASKNGLTLVGSSFKESATAASTFGDNLTRLASRAALTIPTWFLLRNAIQLPVRFLKTGVAGIVSFDTALQKAKKNLRATSTDLEGDFNKLKKEATSLALETGVSTDKIINAFQKFATVGFNFEDSLRGAGDSVRLSTVLFGDAEETANSFSRALRVLVDTSEGAVPVQEQIGDALALTSRLWEDNQFDINEVNQSLEKFAATAKTSNLSIKETLTLLATLGTGALAGSRAGTLLRSSISKLITNLDKLAPSLGIKVNPALDSTYNVLMRVLGAIKELEKTGGKVPVAATEAITEIFGGERGSAPIRTLSTVFDLLEANNKLSADYGAFRKEADALNQEITRQVDIMKNLGVESAKAFVIGITGAEGFKEALQTINGILVKTQKFAGSLGKALNISISPEGFTKTAEDLEDKLFEKIVGVFRSPKFKTLDTSDLLKGLKNNLNEVQLKQLIVDIKEGKVNVPENMKDKVQSILEKNLKSFTVKTDTTIESDTVDLSLNFAEQQDIAKLVLQTQLDILKAQGASESVILKTTGLLSKQLGIEEKAEDILKRKISLEQAISEEKRLQGKITSDDMKLYDIAKEKGVKTAKAIGDVLSGKTDFSSFIRRGGEAVEVFKKDFADLFKQKQAEQFFQGRTVVDEPGLRGGSRIAIESEAIRKTDDTFFDSAVNKLKTRLEAEFLKLKSPESQDVKEMRVGAIYFPSGSLDGANVSSDESIRSEQNQRALQEAIAEFRKTQPVTVPFQPTAVQMATESASAIQAREAQNRYALDNALKEIERQKTLNTQTVQPQPTNVTFNITGDNPEDIANKTLQKWQSEVLNKQSNVGKTFIRALEDY